MSAQTNGKSFWPKWDDNKLFTVILAIIGVYLIVLSGSMIRKNIKEGNRVGLDPVAAPTITVDGRGKVTASPNIASVQVGLLSEGTDVATIQEENSAKMNALLAELRRLGIADADMQTANYSIFPKYDYTDGKSVLSGYQVSQNVTVKVRDISKLSDIFGAAGRLGANQVSGPTFNIEDEEALRAQARTEAIEAAAAKLVELSRQLGVRPVRFVSFSESSGSQPPMFAEMRSLGVGGGGAPEIQPGQLDVEVNVSITFEVR